MADVGSPASEPRVPSTRRNEVLDKTHADSLDCGIESNSLTCSLCHRVYSRSDVLSRHLVQAHGQQAKRAGRPRKNGHSVSERSGNSPRHRPRHATRSSVRQASRRSTPTPSRCASVYTAGNTDADDNTPHNGVGSSAGHVASAAAATGPTPVRIEWDLLPHELGSNGDATSVPILQQQQQSLYQQYSQQQQQYQSQHQSGLAVGDSFQDLFLFSTSEDYAWTTNHAPAAMPSVATFDWGFTDMPDTNMFEAIGALPPPPPPPPPQHTEPQIIAGASPTSTADASGSMTGRTPPDRDSEIVRALKAEEVDGQPNTGDLPNGSPEESAWPTVYYQPNTPVDPVDLPTVTRPSSPTSRVPTAALLSTFAAGSGTPSSSTGGGSLMTSSASINAQARMSMQVLAAYAHRPVWPLPDLANFPSIPSLTACVNCYLAHFAAWLPIVDSPRRSFRVDKAAPVLLMAMAAIGAVYASGGLEKLAFPIDELVRRQIVYICEHDHRFVLEPCVMQASLLQSYFGLYSGSPRLFHHAEISRASLVTACRRMHLLHADYSAARELRRRDPTASREAVAKAMRQDHRYSRLGWAIFLFDVQMFCFFGTPCLYALSDIQVSLPLVSVAVDVAEPGSPTGMLETRPTFGQMMAGLLDNGQLLEEPSDMGLGCLAYALYRLCLEAASAPSFLRKQQQQHTATAQNRLDQLARHVIDTPVSLTSLRLSCVALAHHAYLELTDVGLLSTIKVAAGRSGEQEQQAAQADVKRRLQMDPAGARCLFAHAAMLQCLLNRFTFDTPTEVIWTFDAALAMWAFLRFSGQSLEGQSVHSQQQPGGTPVTDHHVLLTWKPSPLLDDWVRSGQKRLSVQGIGNNDSGAITAASVLKGASERLEVMSWGLAAKYRVVLKGMLAQV